MDVMCLSDGSYVNVIDVQDLGVELETHGFGLLNGVSQLTVRLQAKRKTSVSTSNLQQKLLCDGLWDTHCLVAPVLQDVHLSLDHGLQTERRFSFRLPLRVKHAGSSVVKSTDLDTIRY